VRKAEAILLLWPPTGQSPYRQRLSEFNGRLITAGELLAAAAVSLNDARY
jgi:hypothetical protein